MCIAVLDACMKLMRYGCHRTNAGRFACVYQCVYIVVCIYSAINPYSDRSGAAGLAMSFLLECVFITPSE